MINSLLFQVTMFLYFLSAASYVFHLATNKEVLRRAGAGIAFMGLTTNAVALMVRYVESHQLGIGYVPLSNMYESMAFFALTIAGFHLFFEKSCRPKTLGFMIMPLAFFTMGTATLALSPDIRPLMPALQSDWLFYHVFTSFAGYGAFAFSFGVSIIYLVRKPPEDEKSRLPDRKTLELLNYKAISTGFLFFTIGIVTGAIWAHHAWGTYWSWDPKETWSLVTWILYAILLHLRYAGKLAGKRMAYVSFLGFAAVIFTYWGVNYLLSGLHSYS
jgi:cytochrome c-type biogenesis protein CcsB